MDFSIKNKSREKAVTLLCSYLQNPGRFSILILGGSGVGKTHWVRTIQEEIKDQTPWAKDVETISLASALPTREYWEEALNRSHDKVLLIKQLEKVKPHENLLFEALSTTDGKFGFTKKNVETRVVFTSNYSIQSLRNTEDLISHRLFDRISQLVVKLPDFHEANFEIWEDFKATWKKMHFLQKNERPGLQLKDWLNKNSHKLHGNFRDLDKIAILWHQFRLMGLEEKDILGYLLSIFETYSSFPEQHTDLEDAFYFQKGKTKQQIEEEFRTAFKRWAKLTYGSIRKAAGELKMSPRTMEKW